MASKAPKVKESRAEKARRFQRMGSDMALRDQRLKIEKLLRAKTKLIPNVVEYLVSIGEWEDGEEEEPLVTPSKRPRVGGATSEPESELKAERPPEECTSTLLNKNYTCLAKLPAKHLSRWLSLLEPVQLVPSKMKPMMVRGEPDATWTALAELLEFLTDLSPDKVVLPQSKTLADIAAFEEKLQGMNQSRGKRINLITLPPQWSRHGVYYLKPNVDDDESVEIVHRYRALAVSLPDCFLFDDLDDLHICNAFSEQRAELRSKNSLDEDSVLLLPLFRDSHPKVDWVQPWVVPSESPCPPVVFPQKAPEAVGVSEWVPPPPPQA